VRSNNHKNSLLNLCVTGSYTPPIFSTVTRYPYLRQLTSYQYQHITFELHCTLHSSSTRIEPVQTLLFEYAFPHAKSTFLTSVKRTETHCGSIHCQEQVLYTKEQVSLRNINIRSVPTGSQKVVANCPLETRRIPVEIPF
jgi:hypothetical protein